MTRLSASYMIRNSARECFAAWFHSVGRVLFHQSVFCLFLQLSFFLLFKRSTDSSFLLIVCLFLLTATILPVVQKQHQLLVTLLLCNAAAMEVCHLTEFIFANYLNPWMYRTYWSLTSVLEWVENSLSKPTTLHRNIPFVQ